MRFGNRRGQTLAGILHGEPNDAVVISCHGMLSDKNGSKHQRLAADLEALQLPCLRFDFAGRGESEGRLFDLSFTHEVEDLDAAITYLASRGATRFGLFGSSMGGAVALLAAARDERVRAVATLAAVGYPGDIAGRHPDEARAFLERGQLETVAGPIGRGFYDDAKAHDVIGAVRALHIPLLVLHGEEDDVVPVSDAHDIATEARHVTLEIVPGADHRFSNPVHLKPAMRLAVEFFARHLAPV
ncbi:MAG: alpha/beta fold hydrolase [Deltaproteobacteria bacterium]|nr:alpha/beta fold hydrolase [Deltaproteobacteria bacterium]